eukprot:5366887-Amphidinium_carterae.2
MSMLSGLESIALVRRLGLLSTCTRIVLSQAYHAWSPRSNGLHGTRCQHRASILVFASASMPNSGIVVAFHKGSSAPVPAKSLWIGCQGDGVSGLASCVLFLMELVPVASKCRGGGRKSAARFTQGFLAVKPCAHIAGVGRDHCESRFKLFWKGWRSGAQLGCCLSALLAGLVVEPCG